MGQLQLLHPAQVTSPQMATAMDYRTPSFVRHIHIVGIRQAADDLSQ